MTQGADHLVLVHAEVKGQGDLEGQTFGHAWVENMDTGYVFDNSNDKQVILSTSRYRQLAGVDEIHNEKRYEWDEVRNKIVSSSHWGPWDLVTSSGR